MPASSSAHQNRGSRLKVRCSTCGAATPSATAKAAGWRGTSSRVGARNIPVWYCPADIPADISPPRVRPSGPKSTLRQLFERWPRRKRPVYLNRRIESHRLVFAFGPPDFAEAAGCSPAWACEQIRAGAFDPLDLASVLQWVGQSRANRPRACGLIYNSFATSGPSRAFARAAVIQAFADIGFAVGGCDDPRLLDVLGDHVTVATAERLLRYMQGAGLREVDRDTARTVMLLGRLKGTKPIHSPPVPESRILAELREVLPGAEIALRGSAAGPARAGNIVLINGVHFERAKAIELMAVIRAGGAAAEAMIAALETLAGYRADAAAARRARKRANLARSTAAD